MIYNSLTVGYAIKEGGEFGQYIDITRELNAINVVKGEIPVRPMKDATGAFSNESTQRIEMSFAEDAFKQLKGFVAGDIIKLSLNNGAIVKEEQFLISAVSHVVTAEQNTFALVSLTPDVDGTVSFSLAK